MSTLPLSPIGRRYGRKRDLHDPRDYALPKRMTLQPLPDVVDLRNFCGPIKDQGFEGSCTGHAGAELCEWIHRKYFGNSPIFSPQFVYTENLLAEGTFPQDNGAMPRTICQTLSRYGVCEESAMPYVAGQIVQPSTAQINEAQHYRLGGYHRLNGLQDVLLALGDPTPWPVLLAFQVYESFEDREVALSGRMPVPREDERLLGGHEVLCVGYDMKQRHLIIQNSWGESWGDKGFFTMPFEVAANGAMVSDLWCVHPGYWNKN